MKNLIKILRLGEQNVSRGKLSDENTGRCMWEKGQGANRVRARGRSLSAEQGEGQRHTHTHTPVFLVSVTPSCHVGRS